MKFLDPLNSATFKKIFGDPKHESVIVSFINAMFGKKGGFTIVRVKANKLQKFSSEFLSVQMIGETTHNEVIIDLQLINRREQLTISQAVTCNDLAEQAEWKFAVGNFKPIITIAIATCSLFDHDRYITHHLIMDVETHEVDLTLNQFHYLELEKFNKKATELELVIDQWAYFLKHASEVDQIPVQLQSNKEIVDVFNLIKLDNKLS